MENLLIKGTSIPVIADFIETIFAKIPDSEVRTQHIKIDTETKTKLIILKEIFPGAITVLDSSKDINECCSSTLKDELNEIKKIISPFI